MILVVEGAGDPARTLENIRRLGSEVLLPLRSVEVERMHRSGPHERDNRYHVQSG